MLRATIGYYKKIRLLDSPSRSSGDYRLYGERECSRLSFVRRAREIGFMVDQVRSLLAFSDQRDGDCNAVKALTDPHCHCAAPWERKYRVGVMALAGNVACLVSIAKKRDRGAHTKASYIFSANDIIANLGVIAAGVLVTCTGSRDPDLIVGTVISVIVFTGARRILKLKR